MIATVLRDRILLPDGKNIVDPDKVVDLFLKGLTPRDIYVSEENNDVKQFNLRSDEEIEVFNNQQVSLNYSWLIPEQYLNLDLTEYFCEKLSKLPDDILEVASVRVENELVEVFKRKFENGIRTIIYVVDTFEKNNQVWGVGRGSSCASYLLYLIGLHYVDPIKYGIHYSEFFHD